MDRLGRLADGAGDFETLARDGRGGGTLPGGLADESELEAAVQGDGGGAEGCGGEDFDVAQRYDEAVLALASDRGYARDGSAQGDFFQGGELPDPLVGDFFAPHFPVLLKEGDQEDEGERHPGYRGAVAKSVGSKSFGRQNGRQNNEDRAQGQNETERRKSDPSRDGSHKYHAGEEKDGSSHNEAYLKLLCGWLSNKKLRILRICIPLRLSVLP